MVEFFLFLLFFFHQLELYRQHFRILAECVTFCLSSLSNSPSLASLTAASSTPSRRNGLSTWALRTQSWRLTMADSRTFSRTFLWSEKDLSVSLARFLFTHFHRVLLCNYEISALRCCHSGDMWNYTFLPKSFQWKIFKRLFCFPWAETTSQSLTSWRSGMSTGSSMTWWLRCWSHREPLCGPARTMMEMYSLTSLLRVKIISVFSIVLSYCTHVHPIILFKF